MSVGSRIKEMREKRNLSRSDLAEMLGVTVGAISNYENGISSPKEPILFNIMATLNCDANYLFQDNMKTTTYIDVSTPEEFETLVRKYRDLDLHGQETVSYILDRETERVQQLKQATATPAATRMINYYYRLASAGTGQIIFDMPPTKRIEIPAIPEYRKADYAIGVNGNSMEPVYHDGDTLLVEMTDHVEVGEIGIFLVNGESFVKKRGETELISLNLGSKNVPLNEDARCLGRVIGKL